MSKEKETVRVSHLPEHGPLDENGREILLSLKNVDITFGKGDDAVRAVKNASFDIYKGETFSLVGESRLPARPPSAGRSFGSIPAPQAKSSIRASAFPARPPRALTGRSSGTSRWFSRIPRRP